MPYPDINEFELLYRRNHKFLCMVAMDYVHDQFIAEDVVQDFFIDFWQRGHLIQLTSSFEAYARRAVKYKCIDFIRKNAAAEKRNNILPMTGDTEAFSYDPDESDAHELQHQRYVRIAELIQALPENRREIFIMHAVDKLNYAQIAEKQRISVNTVKTQLRRAYMVLRNKNVITFLGLFTFFNGR